jgi:benzodiazapine receptor
MSNPRLIAILNLFGWAGVLTVNTLANSLPINGYNTGQVSAFYPNLFVPAGFTFAIWSVIYLLMTGFTVTATRWLWHRPAEPAGRLAMAVSPLFLLTCTLNAGWILAWHHLQTGLSVLLMLAFLATLVRAYLALQPFRHDLQGGRRIFLYQFFVVYLGWISVATIANITAWLVSLSWNGIGWTARAGYTLLLAVAAYGILRKPTPKPDA